MAWGWWLRKNLDQIDFFFEIFVNPMASTLRENAYRFFASIICCVCFVVIDLYHLHNNLYAEFFHIGLWRFFSIVGCITANNFDHFKT